MLSKATRQCALALVLLAAAGLRHHLVWGASGSDAFHLRHWLDAAETGCLLGFAWFGARGWLLAIEAVQRRTPGLRALVLASLPLLLLAVLAPPFLSADVADYVMRGRVLALHGGNPYVRMASDFPDDPFLAFGDAGWKRFPLPYGPLVADLQGGLAWLGAQATFLPAKAQFVLSVGLFKLVFAAALLASALLARSIAARLRGGDGDIAFATVAFSPLLLNEAVAQAHNESLLLLTTMLAVDCCLAGRNGRGIVALGLGALTKIVPSLLGPLFVAQSLRARRLPAMLTGSIVVALLVALAWWRFYRDPGSLEFLRRQSAVTGASLPWAVGSLTGIGTAGPVTIGRVLVVAILSGAVVWYWRAGTGQRLVAAAAATMAAMACLGLGGFGPWYHVWWAPLALLGERGWLHRYAVAVSASSPLCYVMWTSARRFDDVHQWVVLAMGIVLPALLASRSPRGDRRVDVVT